MDSEKFSQLVVKNKTKIVFIVIDGLGGLPSSTSATAKSELEVARLPHVDALARESDLGLQKPLEEYMTVGSSAGHLALFGYDPLQYRVGRGIVEAIGLKIKVTDHDIMARGNWAKCDYGASGITVRDRRAGRIETRLAKKLAHKINKEIKNCDNAIVTLHQSVSHRFVAQFRFPYAITGDMARLSDSDPLRDDETVKPVKGLSGSAEEIAKVVNHFLEETYVLLHNEKNANGLTLRGFSTMPQMPSFDTLYQLKAACIAYYPMYLGLAQLLGMKVIAQKKDDTKEQCALLKKNFSKYDFFFL
ncbi:MAG: phosphoglycerate mutase, partial [Parcubacteria group bacterium]|nr:phosphoglycerate mutase [Parcubacteria group bacterium]